MHTKLKLCSFIVSLILPIISHANIGELCKTYPFIKSGINFSDYKKCNKLLQQCVKDDNPLPDESCIKNLVNHNSFCYELNRLSMALEAFSPWGLTIYEEKRKFYLAEILSPADGGISYYIISPHGCIVDTNIDPRELSPALKKQYSNSSFYTEVINKPSQKTNANGTQSFIVNIEIKNTCRACEKIGISKIKYDFDHNGLLKNASIIKNQF